MKMAKADKAEREKVMKFHADLESLIEYGTLNDAPESAEADFSDERLAEFVRGWWGRGGPSLMRVVFGYIVLVDSVCDDEADTLELRKDWVEKVGTCSS